MEDFAQDIMDRAKVMRQELLSPKNVSRYNHGGTFESPANTKGDKTAELTRHSATTELSLEDIISGNSIKIFSSAQDVSEQMNKSITGEMIKVVSSSTEKTGNVVDGKDKPFHEALYETVEMLELPLDDNGELSMPIMMVSPDLYQKIHDKPPTDAEFDARFEDLKARKKVEAITREKNRLARFERPSD